MITHKKICDLVAEGYDKQTGKHLELEYHYSKQDGFNFITVRGTEASKTLSGGGWRDALRDVLIMPWHSQATGWAHCGFLKGAQGIFDQLKYRIPLDEPLILSGHSLGGGVTLLLAQIFSFYGWNVNEWIGFGTPKVFIGRRDLKFPTFSYRHGDDPVTEVPPGIIIKYRHPQDLVQLEDLGDGNDHSITRYQEAMSKYNLIETVI